MQVEKNSLLWWYNNYKHVLAFEMNPQNQKWIVSASKSHLGLHK